MVAHYTNTNMINEASALSNSNLSRGLKPNEIDGSVERIILPRGLSLPQLLSLIGRDIAYKVDKEGSCISASYGDISEDSDMPPVTAQGDDDDELALR